jgi:hypothetical protein
LISGVKKSKFDLIQMEIFIHKSLPSAPVYLPDAGRLPGRGRLFMQPTNKEIFIILIEI